jgi:hypothetical protein
MYGIYVQKKRIDHLDDERELRQRLKLSYTNLLYTVGIYMMIDYFPRTFNPLTL